MGAGKDSADSGGESAEMTYTVRIYVYTARKEYKCIGYKALPHFVFAAPPGNTPSTMAPKKGSKCFSMSAAPPALTPPLFAVCSSDDDLPGELRHMLQSHASQTSAATSGKSSQKNRHAP